jgi:polyisoprenoid-binding protein YceI
MKSLLIPCIVALLSTSVRVAAAPEVYEIDPAHSTVGFKVRHFFTEVPGHFREFSGTITLDTENPEKSSAKATIKSASVDTAHAKRDEHLRSADFFDVSKYPEIVFVSNGVESTGKNTGKVKGQLTMHGVTKEVELDSRLLGKGKGMQGEKKAGWKATTTINRKDFGLNWGNVVEGTAVVADEVEIELNIEANLK